MREYNTEEYFEDQDYIRYYQLYNDPQVVEIDADSEHDPEELLEDDEITAGEEGFLLGYDAA